MNWEQTIQFIRTQPEYSELVEKAYFDKNLSLNVERFRVSEEFIETMKLLKEYRPNAKTVLDIGSGNGISAIALAIEGYKVVAIEPDTSDTVGAGAIRKLKSHYNLSNLEVYEAFGEELLLPDENFEIVYTRQCMHHAYDLDKFVAEASRVLKKGGLFMTVRDHVVFDEKDKNWFLDNHPLQKFYEGENAFKASQYKNAMQKAGFEIYREIKHYESVINYFPASKETIANMIKVRKQRAIAKLDKRIGRLSTISLIQDMLFKIIKLNNASVYDESKIPGRMYSYLCFKK